MTRSVEKIAANIALTICHGDDEVCMCGESIHNHLSGMQCGHEPVPAMSYHLSGMVEEMCEVSGLSRDKLQWITLGQDYYKHDNTVEEIAVHIVNEIRKALP